MPGVAEAQALLAARAETNEVKAAIAQRERRLHLQLSYGQAMMLVKGYAASETKAAFQKARTFVEQAEALGEPLEDPLALFSVLYEILRAFLPPHSCRFAAAPSQRYRHRTRDTVLPSST